MDTKWKTWYDSTLLPLLSPPSGNDLPPEPALERLLARDPTQVDMALLVADTDHTQDYVFESTKLPEIRAGSEILRRLNEQDLIGILADAGLPANSIDGNPPGCVVYAGGGSLMAFVPASIAPDLADKIERHYPTQTGKATVTCVWRRFTPQQIRLGWNGGAFSLEQVNAMRGQPDWQRVAGAYGVTDGGLVPAEEFEWRRGFGQLVRVMNVLLRQRKETPPVVPIVEALPHACRCRICQVRPAESMYPYFGEMWPLCGVCRIKAHARLDGEREGIEDNHRQSGWAREARSYQVQRFLDWLDKNDPELKDRYLGQAAGSPIHDAQDLDELGKACRSRSGYASFVYADGNRMGQTLESLSTLQGYCTFSRGLSASIQAAAYQALAENLHPTMIDRVDPNQRPLGKGFIHPLELLVSGGDDLILILPGDAALPVAVRLCQLFEQAMRKNVPPEVWASLPADLRNPTLSAGVVIATSHNPVRVLRQVSKELCKNAKQRAYDEGQADHPTSALDFLLIKSQSMLRRDVKQLRRMSPYYFGTGPDVGRYLTAAPYTLAESCRLLDLLKLMRQVDFPTSQLQGLVAALQRGRQYGSIHYLYQQARLTARLGEARQDENVLAHLPKIWRYDDQQDPIPWQRVPGKEGEFYASVLPDLLELYPFVPRPATSDLWREILTEAAHYDKN